MGIRAGHVYEVIISTFAQGRRPTAAPMGVTFQRGRVLVVRPFKTSLTFDSLCLSRCGVVNIVTDPMVFHRSAFKELTPRGRLPSTWFEHGRSVDAPRLRSAQGFVEFTVRKVMSESRERARLICRIQLAQASREFTRPYLRSDFATIESIIHATRVEEFLSRGWVGKANELIRQVERYRALVRRVSPNSKHTKIMDELASYIRRWKRKHASHG